MTDTKSIRIPKAVHKELKAFVGQQEKESINEFAGFAIMKELKERGHKFISKPEKSKK